MGNGLKMVCITQLVNVTLAANLVLPSNYVLLNPGPVTGLWIFHLNICRLRNKMDELQLFCEGQKPHVLSLKIWLDESFLDREVHLPGYNIICKERNRNGKGIAVYIDRNLNGLIHPTLCKLMKLNLFGLKYLIQKVRS